MIPTTSSPNGVRTVNSSFFMVHLRCRGEARELRFHVWTMEAQIHDVYTAVARFLHGHFVAMEAATAWRSINDPTVQQFLIEAFHGTPPSVILLTK